MKKICFFTLFSLLVLNIFGQTPANGLVAHYRMDGDAQDASGNNNHGTPQGDVNFTTAIDRYGVVGKAVMFDGIDDYVSASMSTPLTTVTTSFWMKPANLDIKTPLCIGVDNGIGSNPALNGISVYIPSNSVKILVSDLQTIQTSHTFPTANQWYFVALQQNGGQYKLFVNNTMVFSGSGTLPRVANQIRLGSATNIRFFNGSLDDIRIYNRALSDVEVQAIYKAETPPIDITTGLVAHYKMDGDAQDASGYNNHGIAPNGISYETNRFGNINMAASFDGINDYVSVNSSNSLESPTSEITISNWICLDNATLGAYYLAKTNNSAFHYRCGAPNGGMYFGRSGIDIIISTFPLASMNWYMLSYTYNGQSVKFYINGQLINTSITSGEISPNNTPLEIGRDAHGPVEWFKGKLDDIRIYNRALSDSEVQYIYQSECGTTACNPELLDLTISNLNEPINQNSYTVPREATIHYYLLAKKTSNPTIPVKNAVLKYTIGTDPIIRTSLPSDDDGLIDLNITVGGSNVSDPDWITTLNTIYQVQFHSLAVGLITGTNAFSNFEIKVIDKATDYKQELGIGIGFKAGQDAFQNSNTDKIDMGDGLKMNLKGAVGLKVGGTTDAYIKIKPISENNWNVYLNGGIGVFTGFGSDFGIGVQDKDLNVGTKVKTDIDLNGGIRLEAGYNFNLNNRQELFKLAEFLFSLNVGDANSKETSIIFRNLAERSEPALTNLSYSSAFSYGADFNIGADATAKNKLRLINLPGYGNIPALGLEAKINATGKFNDIIKYELEKNVGYHESNSIDVSAEASGVINEVAELTKGNRKNNPTTKSQPFSNFSGSLENNLTIQRSFSTSDHSNPIGGLLSYSSKSSELSLIPSSPEIKFNKVFTNKYYYGENAIKNLYVTIFNPVIIDKLNNNTLSLFLTNKSNSLVGSAWINDGVSGSMFNQMYDLNIYMAKTVKDFNLPSEQIKMISEQEITLIDKGSKPFTLPKFKKRGFEIIYTSWNTYTHKHKESKYIKTLDRTLLTLDYPEIHDNLELPQQDPITILKTKLEAELNQIGQDIMDSVQEFITSITQTINNAFTIVLTNFNLLRKTAEGKILFDPSNKTLNSTTPSVFTFTIPSNTFQTNTNLDFSFYYPNNEVIAITPNDTFRIISDVFTLKAIFNTTNLNTTYNGNFNINTNFSTSDLEFASLPANLIASVLFLPNGSSTWQVIGAANVDIPFSQMGIFALGVKISNDKVPPTINVLNPTQYLTPNYYEITLSDNKSGIDWAKSIVTANGKKMTINRISNGNTFRIPINEIPSNSNGIFILEVKTLDLAGHPNTYFSIYPCEEQIIIKGLELDPNNPILKKALIKITSSTMTPLNKDLIFRAGNFIELKAGFETKGRTFKAEIGGCSN